MWDAYKHYIQNCRLQYSTSKQIFHRNFTDTFQYEGKDPKIIHKILFIITNFKIV